MYMHTRLPYIPKMSKYYGQGAIVVRTHDGRQNPHFSLFWPTICACAKKKAWHRYNLIPGAFARAVQSRDFQYEICYVNWAGHRRNNATNDVSCFWVGMELLHLLMGHELADATFSTPIVSLCLPNCSCLHRFFPWSGTIIFGAVIREWIYNIHKCKKCREKKLGKKC